MKLGLVRLLLEGQTCKGAADMLKIGVHYGAQLHSLHLRQAARSLQVRSGLQGCAQPDYLLALDHDESYSKKSLNMPVAS
jgi:hypothetical protein